MLVHICCSVDSHFFIKRLKRDFAQEPLVAFFYDPNIHPYAEYRLRYLDVKRSCDKLGVRLIEGAYDFTSWIEAVRGLEDEPEKGRRCEVCFDKRLDEAAKKALELGERRFTTTLLVSPLKSRNQLIDSAKRYERSGLEFVAVDYRSGGGTQEQSRVAKQQQLYRQDYCGCIFGLTKQRQEQNRLLDELFSPVSAALLPASIEERLALYSRRMELEEQGKGYRIIKHRFLNYRQLSFRLIKGKDQVVAAHALAYSTLSHRSAKGRIEYSIDNIYYFNRSEIRFISLTHYNRLAKSSYKDIYELIFSPSNHMEDQTVREAIMGTQYDLTPIIVTDIDAVVDSKLQVQLDAKCYEDTKERLILL